MRGILLVAILWLAMTSCQKDEPTRWLSENRFPLVESRLYLNDFIADSLLDSENGELALILKRNVFKLTLDSLFDIPADTTVKSFQVPVLQLELPAGVTLLNETETFSFEDLETQLRSAAVKTGLLRITATNTIASRMLFRYRVPGAILEGSSVDLQVEVPAAIDGEPGQIDIEIDLEGYLFDLTGPDGNSFNSMITTFELRTPNDVSGVVVTNQDIVSLQAIYSDISLSYAEGYFGNEAVEITNEPIDFDMLEPFAEANLLLPEASATITLANGFGADFRAILTQFTAINTVTGNEVELTGQLTGGPINLSRAIQPGGILIPQITAIQMDQGNSNINEFISNIPNLIELLGTVELNPLGNISNFNDFLTDESSLDMDVDLRIPLSFALEGLVLRDTLDLGDGIGNDLLTEGSLYVVAQNFFPIRVSLALYVLRSDGTELALNTYLNPGGHGLTSQEGLTIVGDGEKRAWQYRLPAAVIEEVLHEGNIIAEVRFDSESYPDIVTIQENQYVDIKIAAEGQFSIHVD